MTNEYETPLMRDISKMFTTISLGLIIGFAIFLFAIFGWSEVSFNIDAAMDGYNIITERSGQCFYKEDGSASRCRGGAWPVSILLVAPIVIGVPINIWLWQYNKKLGKEIKDKNK